MLEAGLFVNITLMRKVMTQTVEGMRLKARGTDREE